MVRDDDVTVRLLEAMYMGRFVHWNFFEFSPYSIPTIEEINEITRRNWLTWHGEPLQPSYLEAVDLEIGRGLSTPARTARAHKELKGGPCGPSRKRG